MVIWPDSTQRPSKAYPHAAMECRHRAPSRAPAAVDAGSMSQLSQADNFEVSISLANPKTQVTRRNSLMQRYIMAIVRMLGGADTGLVYGERAVH